MKYLLDSNILIGAKNGFYAFDICPGFWTWLKGFNEMKSIGMVRAEILKGKDDLAQWVESDLPGDYFIVEDNDIQMAYREVAGYVNSLTIFIQSVRDAFLDGADGWLIAAAMVRGVTIVTHEKFDRNCRRKVLLPVIAEYFNVDCLRITDVLRLEKVTFK